MVVRLHTRWLYRAIAVGLVLLGIYLMLGYPGDSQSSLWNLYYAGAFVCFALAAGVWQGSWERARREFLVPLYLSFAGVSLAIGVERAGVVHLPFSLDHFLTYLAVWVLFYVMLSALWLRRAPKSTEPTSTGASRRMLD